MPIDLQCITQLRTSRRALAVGAAGAVASVTGAASLLPGRAVTTTRTRPNPRWQ